MRIFLPEVESNYTIDICAELINTYGHEISHITAPFIARDRDQLQSLPPFKSTTILDSKDFFRLKPLRDKYASYFELLDIDIINFFKEIEMDCYNLSDRTNFTSVTFRERKRLFRDLIRFWTGYLPKEKIDAVYYACAPHTVWELVLLQACRYLNIPVFYLSHTTINNRMILRDRYDALEPVPKSYLAGKTSAEILADLPTSLREDFLAESIVNSVIKAENDVANKLERLNSTPEILQKRVTNKKIPLIQQIKHLIAPWYHLAFSASDRKFYLPMAMDEKSTTRTWMAAKSAHEKFAADLKEFYEQHATATDLNKPYVYVPLHLQPELTTQPEAGMFEDHLLLVETIAKALPDGWNIYIKENPRQYDVTINTASAMHYRDISDMKDFLAVSDKVSFVPQSIKTTDLLTNAKAVVVLTGTAGWESLNLSKPCISFAHPWYSPCNSCIKAQTPEELSAAFKKVQTMSAEEVKADVMRFLHYYSDRLLIGTLADPDNVAYNTVPRATLLREQAKAMNDYLLKKAAIPYTPKAQNS